MNLSEQFSESYSKNCPKRQVVLNSHGIQNIMVCPRKFVYNEIFEPTEKSVKMEKGIVFAKFLEIYYRRKMRGKPTVVTPFWTSTIIKRTGCTKEEADIVWRAAANYSKVYGNETWEPLVAEAGFTIPFYEDEELSIYLEGRPDLVVRDKTTGHLIVVDHKTQGSFYDLPHFSHQPMAYLYAISKLVEQPKYYFCYNYIVFKKDPDYRRSVVEVSIDQINMWRSEVLCYILRVLKMGEFFRTFNCSTQFGLCDFYKVCINPSEQYQLWYLNNLFKYREKRKASWSMSMKLSSNKS